MVHQQELHYSLASLSGEVRLGLDLPTVHDGHCAGSHGLGRLLHLHQAHPAVARDGETVVVAEPRNLHSDHGGSLQHSRAGVHQNLQVETLVIVILLSLSSHLLAVNETFQFLRSSGHSPRGDLAEGSPGQTRQLQHSLYSSEE